MSFFDVLIAYGLCCFYTTLVLLQTIFKILVNGRSFLKKKERTPPSCLMDSDYGHHNYIKLKVSDIGTAFKNM